MTIGNALRPLVTGAVALACAAPASAAFVCPSTGGDFIFALEAKVPTIDQHASVATQSRNVAMNVFESLMTRDERMNPMLELATSVEESADKKTYTFKIRPGATFHNGKKLTSADVHASYRRYGRIGVDRSILDIVERYETPDDATFVVVLKEARPTFLETFSAFTSPIVIIPSENADAAPLQLPIVGTGPFQMVEFVADSHAKLRRFDGYVPDTRHSDVAGFGGYKKACVDTVTFRMMVEPGARLAALEVGEVHGVEDVPTVSHKRLAGDPRIRFLRMESFAQLMTYPNFSFPPTDNLKFRQAVQAALNMEEIMEAATDGAYKLNHALQFPGGNYYSDVAKELYNQRNADKAKRLLQEAGYKGEKLILLTNREYILHYNSSVVMNEQLKAVGINSELLVLDWPAALSKSQKDTTGWNFFFTGWNTVYASGGAQSLRNLGDPANVHKPKDNRSDPEFMQHWTDVARGATLDERKAAFARAQQRVYDEVMAIPLGMFPKVQAVRVNVENFKPYYMPRIANVWIKG